MIGALVGAGASLLGGLFGGSSAKKAAQAQADAMREAARMQQEMYYQTRDDLSPWRHLGSDAVEAIGGELGLVPGLASNFQTTPGYQFQVQEGERGVVNNLAALGMRDSGAALKELEKFRQGLAAQEYGNYFARLMGLSGAGQNAAAQTGSLGAQAAAGAGMHTANAGSALGAGVMGSTNMLLGGLGGAANFFGQMQGAGGSPYGSSYFPPAPVTTTPGVGLY